MDLTLEFFIVKYDFPIKLNFLLICYTLKANIELSCKKY